MCCRARGFYASQVHWFSIVNSLLIVLFLTAMIAMILIRNLHRDIMRYNRVPTDEEKAEEREETGWKVRCTAWVMFAGRSAGVVQSTSGWPAGKRWLDDSSQPTLGISGAPLKVAF